MYPLTEAINLKPKAMNLKIFTAAVFVAPFWLTTTANAVNPSPRQPIPASLSSLSALVAQADWKEFSTTEGGFAVSMPGAPKQEKETDQDGLTSYSFSVELEQPESVYMVTYYDVPEVAQATPEQVKELLDGAPDAFAKGGNTNLTRSQNITLDGNPGREFDFTSDEGFAGKGRVYLVKQRLFLVVGVTPQTQNAQRFLDSFRLL